MEKEHINWASNLTKVFGGPGTFFQKGSWSPKAPRRGEPIKRAKNENESILLYIFAVGHCDGFCQDRGWFAFLGDTAGVLCGGAWGRVVEP